MEKYIIRQIRCIDFTLYVVYNNNIKYKGYNTMKHIYWEKSICLILIVLLSLGLCSCALGQVKSSDCSHSYYLSDHSAPTGTTDGYNVYTCRDCGNSYREVVPATGQKISTSDPMVTNAPQSGYGKDSKSVKLFDLPVYSGEITPRYESDITDSKGYRHRDCYSLLPMANNNDAYVRYEIDDKYSTLSGKLYKTESGLASMWIEIYDGDEFIYSSAKVNDDNPVAEFSIDISGIDYLTIYPLVDSYFYAGRIIADQLMVSK